MTKKSPVTNQYLAIACLLIVFAIDVLTPDVYVVDILYLSSILLVFRQNTRTIVGFCAAACLLILINAIFFTSTEYWFAWINHGVSVCAIFITTYIAIHYRKSTFESAVREQQYITALKEMLFMTSHQVRKPVANILGLTEMMCKENEGSKEVKTQCGYLHVSALELDALLRELNAFIEDTEQAQKRDG